METISIVVPCLNEQEAIPLFYDAFLRETAAMDVAFEFWFIDDGSTDGTMDALRALRKADERVHFISFSRNFGKESAMYAGMQAATGAYVAIMDVDLQDPPSLLPDMLHGIRNEGYDCVATRRVTRKGEPKVRSFFARAFYRLINRISKTQIVDGARDFRLMTRQMVESILSLGEVSRFSKGIFSWVGYRTKWLEYENVERVAGETKWSFWKLLLYSIDGIIGFSTAPLAIASVVGVLFCLVAFVLILYFFFKTLIWGDPVAGFPATICIILLLGGIQLFCVGILGQYLSKTYLETKRRPIYIARERE
ncbi:MAG: glycosyltransferase family 2 protein [Clostridiales bacterium]|nr:glycosyltransferase family 2 protein [Clostridiales bacterium]MDO4349881.1 glycosyltransferase family 2 protein [Eubacteriales bacterium]MDY4007651.1 glycosyltransferase family 2 protein [Candidatus Limiplasma sp.]